MSPVGISDLRANQPRRYTLIAGGLCCYAVVQAVVVAIVDPLPFVLGNWLNMLNGGIVWGSFVVLVLFVQWLPSVERLAWSVVAIAPGILAIGTALSAIAQYWKLPFSAAFMLVAVFAASSLTLLVRNQQGDTYGEGWSFVALFILELLLIYVALLAIVTTLGSIIEPRYELDLICRLILDTIVLFGIVALVSSRPMIFRIQALVWGSVVIRIIQGLFSLPSSPGTHSALVVIACESLRWSMLALAATQGTVQQKSPASLANLPLLRVQPMWLGKVCMWLAICVFVYVQHVPTEPTLLMVLLAVVHEIVRIHNYRVRLHKTHRFIRNEHNQLVLQARHTEDRMQQLARLIHDQAGPISGLWHVQRNLAHVGAQEFSNRLVAQIEQLHVLAEQLRSILKGQERMPHLLCVATDVLPIMFDVLDAAFYRAALMQVQLSSTVSANSAIVLGNPVSVRRILDNLVINALDATPKDGLVMIELWNDRSHPHSLTMTVRDSGRGLSREEQNHIWEADLLPNNVTGMGLGLQIVRQLATEMDGECGVVSTAGQGSAFWVRLPLIPSD